MISSPCFQIISAMQVRLVRWFTSQKGHLTKRWYDLVLVANSNLKKENIKNIIFSFYSLECEKQNRLFFTLFAKKQKINFLKRSLSELKVFEPFEFKKVKLYLYYF